MAKAKAQPDHPLVEGRKAYMAGHSILDNPYAHPSKSPFLRQDWDEGFIQAMRHYAETARSLPEHSWSEINDLVNHELGIDTNTEKLNG